MSYQDDEEEGGLHNPADPAGQGRPRPQSGLRADFRADPAWHGRGGAPRPPEPSLSADYSSPAPPPPSHDPNAGYEADYVEPARGPSTAGYRAPAPDPYQPRVQPQPPVYADDGYDDGQYDDQQAYAEPPAKRRGIINAAIVAGGLVVFGGIIFYAYNQGMRAGTESVAPILRADASPTKVKPEQPGGLEVPHQDRLVYDRLNPSANGDEGEVERLLPPPETPMERPRAGAEPSAEEPMMPMAEEGEGELAGGRHAAAPEPMLPPPQQPVTQQPSYKPTAPASQPTQAPVQQSAVPPAHTAGVPATTATARPQQLVPPASATPPKPAPQVAQAPVAAPPAPKPTTAPAPAPTAAATGSVRLQVAAVDSEGKAAAEWSRLQRKFPGELGGLSMRTVRVDLGPKGIFYRIQGGPVDEARAKQICTALAAQGAGCVLVR
ncbi:SPOR domain-containing protein [Niveispirillum sp. SYP-B3756]|uniref:SPOR domain-containing protein n=1 Tax=Niveispirillum sp. SYP-B3756 TaxID=2662178 RepID=UPI0012914C48|nr:SPOR domain-containing protein [Niveispirillum sp. SYP-B3756]MQP65284.1 SPOR domain-containing protein [Niveispirillum sp. SYP-B3756]